MTNASEIDSLAFHAIAEAKSNNQWFKVSFSSVMGIPLDLSVFLKKEILSNSVKVGLPNDISTETKDILSNTYDKRIKSNIYCLSAADVQQVEKTIVSRYKNSFYFLKNKVFKNAEANNGFFDLLLGKIFDSPWLNVMQIINDNIEIKDIRIIYYFSNKIICYKKSHENK